MSICLLAPNFGKVDVIRSLQKKDFVKKSMSRIIAYTIASSNKNLHEDFLMCIPSLGKEKAFDTYYFWDGAYDTDGYETLIPLIDAYLLKCKHTILGLSENETNHIPVDFSDQYYGVFKVTRISADVFEFKYGWVENTTETSYDETNDAVIFTIGETPFNEDFVLQMQPTDIIDSFRLYGK